MRLASSGYAIFTGVHHAGLWCGTPESWVDLHPEGSTHSEVFAMTETYQAGLANFAGIFHAGIWTGTADTWADLHPSNATYSVIVGAAESQQFGSVVIGGSARACLRSGTADSCTSLHPVGSTQSVGLSTTGEYQAGYAILVSGRKVASVWNGTAESWENLSLTLPGSWGNSEASSAWTEGVTLNVCGWANSLDRGRTEAILWSREVSGCAFRVPNGCAADFDHDADFDSDDISGFFAAFEAGSICGDADFDGDTDSDDVIEFFRKFESGTCLPT